MKDSTAANVLIVILMPFLIAQNHTEFKQFSQKEIDDSAESIDNMSGILERISANGSISDSDLKSLSVTLQYRNPDVFSADRARADEIHELYWKSREVLLNHEGHASHFVNKIVEHYEALERGEASWSVVKGDIRWDINALQVMPSHECVVGLTSLLGMQKNWFGNRYLGRKQIVYNGQAPNDRFPSIAGMAASALYELGIADGAAEEVLLPGGQKVKLGYGYGGDFFVSAWQEWWQEVLDGERVFQFEGDPARYNAEGPVGPDWQPRSVRRQKEKQLAGLVTRSEEGKEPPSLANPWLKGAVILLIGAIIVFLGSRLRRAS
ncbi:hypothetical protein [Roseibacillus ishigakijimensis]|uniref:Uncharacterized protein n=1 Tax=Roseibacillus ishigakijimensis TaxID=454146 RepID=A0A934RNZ9_9BACT|nr:hypothetical protein [Roseibacillus ishigakijimensis]MBK1832479.1 hypothetical protein [Roseibacillus ishigakijimensis]